MICRSVLPALSTAVAVLLCPSCLDSSLAYCLASSFRSVAFFVCSPTTLFLDLLVLLLLLPRPLRSFVDVWLAISCMSDPRRVLVNAADLELLIQAASQLSAAAISLATSASSQPRSDVGSFIQIAAESEPEGLDNRQFVWDSQFNRIAEDGPGPIPDQLFEFGRISLPCSEYTAHIRVAEAFRAGFWARVALDCAAPYQRIEPGPRVPAHWVVLRVGGRQPATRFENLTSFEEFVRGASDSVLVYEVFQNITEVHVFCQSARVFVPRCLVWRSRH